MSRMRHDMQKKACRAGGGMVSAPPPDEEMIAPGAPPMEAPVMKPKPASPPIGGKRAKKRMDRPMPFMKRACGGRADPMSEATSRNPMMGTAAAGRKG